MQGGDSPPQVSSWGASPPNFTHCLHNKLHCSIVDDIACIGIVPQGNHIFFCLKKMSPPQIKTSSYAYEALEGGKQHIIMISSRVATATVQVIGNNLCPKWLK